MSLPASNPSKRPDLNRFGAWMFVSGAACGVVLGYVLRWVGV